MAARVHRPLKVIEFYANDIWRRRYELSEQLQDSHIDVARLSETRLKLHERLFILNYHSYRTDSPGRRGIPHKHIEICYMCDTYDCQWRSLFVRDKPILLSERMLHKNYGRKGSVATKKKSLVVNLKGLGAKTN
jgi:hypothetical protein